MHHVCTEHAPPTDSARAQLLNSSLPHCTACLQGRGQLYGSYRLPMHAGTVGLGGWRSARLAMLINTSHFIACWPAGSGAAACSIGCTLKCTLLAVQCWPCRHLPLQRDTAAIACRPSWPCWPAGPSLTRRYMGAFVRHWSLPPTSYSIGCSIGSHVPAVSLVLVMSVTTASGHTLAIVR
jgi:hypothetical protein